MEKRKYRILIADDEYWTREKLRRMIEWEKYSLECLEPAKDGNEVLQRMKTEHPDILITDINMPFVDGVELLRRVKEDYPDVVAFVVSGYDDFEYVRNTFLSGALNYLVKPVTKVDLINAIVNALEIIGRRENKKMQLMKEASLIQDYEYSEMLREEKTESMPAFSISGNMDFSGMSLMLIKFHNMHELIQECGNDRNLFSCHVKKEFRRVAGQENMIVFNYIYRSNEFVIISEMSNQELVKLAEKIKVSFNGYSRACLTFCIGKHSYSMDSIYMAYVEAVSLLMTRSFCRKSEIVLSDKGKEAEEKNNIVRRLTGVHEKKISNYLQSGNTEALMRVILEEVGLAKCEKEQWTYLEVRHTVKQIRGLLVDFAVQERGKKEAAELDNFFETVEKEVESLDIQAVCQVLKEAFALLEPGYREAPSDTMKGIVKQIAAYIQENYFEELTLDFLAKKYNVGNSYLSKVFRQEMGETLILYITKRRLEKAKEYMQSKEINLTEIAFLVGYDDYTYFGRVFKKNVGISPREYRERCLKGEDA